jgi:hypothetical protein
LSFECSSNHNVQNAGLVIVVPFLPRFFDSSGLLVDGRFRDAQAAARGVAILQHIVGIPASMANVELALNKLLCGLSALAHIDPSIFLTNSEEYLAGQLCEEIVSLWHDVSQSTVTALQMNFLQREGILTCLDDSCQLTVQRRSFDGILNTIPWSFTTAVLPWMAQPLSVTWI